MSKKKGRYVIMKKIGGLKKIQFHRRPVEKVSKVRDKDAEGEYVGEFNEASLPMGKTGLTIYWNDHKDAYCWGGTAADLIRLVDLLKWRYPRDYPDTPNAIIKGKDVDVSNYFDPFFQQVSGKSVYMFNGKILFDLEKPIDELLYFSYLDNPKVFVKDGVTKSKYITNRAEYEMEIPEMEKEIKRGEADKDIDAAVVLKGLTYDSQKLLAQAMNIKNIDFVNPDPDDLFLALKHTCVSNHEKMKGYGKLTYQDRFLELSKLPKSTLSVIGEVLKAMRYRIIIKSRLGYTLNMEPIVGVKGENELIQYFVSDANAESYMELTVLLEEKEKHLSGVKD